MTCLWTSIIYYIYLDYLLACMHFWMNRILKECRSMKNDVVDASNSMLID